MAVRRHCGLGVWIDAKGKWRGLTLERQWSIGESLLILQVILEMRHTHYKSSTRCINEHQVSGCVPDCVSGWPIQLWFKLENTQTVYPLSGGCKTKCYWLYDGVIDNMKPVLKSTDQYDFERFIASNDLNAAGSFNLRSFQINSSIRLSQTFVSKILAAHTQAESHR